MNKLQARGALFVASASVLCLGLQSSMIASNDRQAVRSWPPDVTPYVREALRAEGTSLALGPPSILVVDVVVNNTDPNLTNTDVFNDGETSIAVNPQNLNEIVISAFSGGWGANAPIFHTTDGGLTWTKRFTVPPPPGWPLGCPCDWTWDYGRNNELSAVILANSPTTGGVDIVTGTTTNPAQAAAWNYFDPPGAPVQAQETNINVPASLGNADQPWVLVNPDPFVPGQDNVYVAWDDFNNSDGVDGPDMRIAVSYGLNPPDFTVDVQAGNSLGGVNPGLRLAKDPASGAIWALWGRNVAGGAGGSKNMDYMLNRTTDGGMTWALNGNAFGIVVVNADSTQPQPKFGTVNALLGGVHHAAVDPNTGDLYYVYGNRDAGTNNNRLAIRRIFSNGAGGVNIGPQSFVTGQIEAALPVVAVNQSGTVAVFYYSFNGFTGGFPDFTAHLALSSDQGASFTDVTLVNFQSSATDNGNSRQRVLGDYMQMEAVGDVFYGSFTANGVPFGRPFANHDPIFFRAGNLPPVAMCRSFSDFADADCCITVDVSDVDDGSFDPNGVGDIDTLCITEVDGIPVGCQQSVLVCDDGTFAPHTVTLTITDLDGESDSCVAMVTVMDNTPPQVIVGELIELWPPSHEYHTFNLSDCVESVEDNCNGPLDVETVGTIVSIYSDEPEDARGGGDGHTLEDIVILGPTSFMVRSERAGASNGRVYGITFEVVDASGNVAVSTCFVGVPRDQFGDPPIDDGPGAGYTVFP